MSGPEVVFLAGYIVSSGFGEIPGPAGRISVEAGRVRVAIEGQAVQKVESGAGWIAGGDLDVRAAGPVSVGVGWHHRDGGAWTKEAVWGRLGIVGRGVRLGVRHDFSSVNKVSIVEVEGMASRGRLRVRPLVGAGTWRDGAGLRRAGWFAEVWVGVGGGVGRGQGGGR